MLGRWITPAIRDLHLKILTRVPATTMARLLAVADCDVRDALERVHAPILCLAGRHDRLIPRSATRTIQQHSPAARVVVLDGPHCLLQCVPAEAVRQIREFLQKLS